MTKQELLDYTKWIAENYYTTDAGYFNFSGDFDDNELTYEEVLNKYIQINNLILK